MALTVEGDIISEVFLAITDELRNDYERRGRDLMMRKLNPQNVDETQASFIVSMLAAGRSMSQIYRAICLNYVELFCIAEGVEVSRRDLERNVVEFDENAFVQRMVGAGIKGYKRKLSQAGVPMRSMSSNPRQNELFLQSVNNVSGDFSNHVFRSGRESIVNVSEQLEVFKGWGRNPSSGACDFCMMLATRDNFRSKSSASFQGHRSCACSPEPRVEGWKPSPEHLQAYGRFLDNRDSKGIEVSSKIENDITKLLDEEGKKKPKGFGDVGSKKDILKTISV